MIILTPEKSEELFDFTIMNWRNGIYLASASRKFFTIIAEPKTLNEVRLIKVNIIMGFPKNSIANPATSGPTANPNERFVNIKACAIGTSLKPTPGRWKLTVRSIGKKHHPIPFMAEIMRRSGRESVDIRSA